MRKLVGGLSNIFFFIRRFQENKKICFQPKLQFWKPRGLCVCLMKELQHHPASWSNCKYWLHSWQHLCIPTVVVARASDPCNSCVPCTLPFILCNGTTTDVMALMFKPFSDYYTSICPLNLAGRNGSFSCCLLTNLPRATLQVARKVMCLWHRAKPDSVSVDLFCESYFFLFHLWLNQHSVKLWQRKRKISGSYDRSIKLVRILMWDTANIYCSKSEMDFSTG